MSQPAASPGDFVPFHPAPAAPRAHGSAPADLRVVPPAQPAAPFAPMAPPGAPHSHPHPTPAAAPGPLVTLQREGERITGIRIECACGQIIDLACSY